jgi:hypothetical protein
LYAGELLAEEMAGGRFGVDFGLEIGGVEFHELVGVAGKAVGAADFAPAVRVDGPAEGHVGFGAVQDAPRRNLEILHAALGFEGLALGSELGDPHKCHGLFSLFIRLLARGEFGRIWSLGWNLPIRLPGRPKWTITAS